MLKRIRVILATIVFALITLLFLDFTGTMHVWFSWLAKIQFLPAVLALNVIVVAVLVILTLLLGSGDTNVAARQNLLFCNMSAGHNARHHRSA